MNDPDWNAVHIAEYFNFNPAPPHRRITHISHILIEAKRGLLVNGFTTPHTSIQIGIGAELITDFTSQGDELRKHKTPLFFAEKVEERIKQAAHIFILVETMQAQMKRRCTILQVACISCKTSRPDFFEASLVNANA